MKNQLVIIVLLFSVILYPQTADKQIRPAISNLYNFNFNKATQQLDFFSVKHKNDPRGYYYKSVMNLWFFLGTLDEAYKDSFDYYSDKAVSILENLGDKNESDKIKKFFWLGMIDYNRSVIAARSNDFASALVSVNNMRRRLDEVINLNPEFYDAYLGIGLSNFAFAEVPAALKWAANLVGFESDKELGLNYLHLVAEKGSILKTDAQFYLSQIYSRTIIDYNEAEKILNSLIRSFPKNLLFNYFYALIKYELNDLNASEKIARNIIASNDSLLPFIISNSHLLLGNVFFSREQYDSALIHYSFFRDKRINNDYLGFANLRSGLCHELLGNRKQAIKFYEKTDEGNKDIDEDIYAEKIGKLLIQKPISNEFKLTLRARNLIKTKKFKDAEDILSDIISNKEFSSGLKAEAYLLLSESELLNKKFNNAFENAQISLKLNNNKDTEISARAYYFSALALFNLNRTSEAVSFLNKIEDLNEFDFQTSLKNKSYALFRKITKQSDSNQKIN
ncbi:tetratricopeptide repeat protein [Ignavibacterium album]|uniref:tetratricopeptide repeat protein n=2 Tax=Ignavibacterium TaxID=795750 RepID=UPI0035B89F96